MTQDFFSNPFSPGRRYAPWLDLAVFLVGALDAFINKHVWTPAVTYYIVVFLVLADFVTGLLCGHQSATGMETRKAKKILFTLVSYTALMYVANKMGRNEPALFWMPQAMLLPIVVINLTSVIKNLSLLGYLPKKIAVWLYRNIDTYKNSHSLPHNNEYRNTTPLEQLQVDRPVPDAGPLSGNQQLQSVPETPFD